MCRVWPSSRHGPFTCAFNSVAPWVTRIAYKSFVNIFSLRTATWLSVTVVAAGLVATAGCSSSSSSSSTSTSTSTSTSSASASASNNTLALKQSKINNSGLPSACRLLPGWYGRFVGFWPDGVVPVRVEAVAVDRQGFHLLLGVDEASGVFTGIQLGSDGQPGGCGGG